MHRKLKKIFRVVFKKAEKKKCLKTVRETGVSAREGNALFGAIPNGSYATDIVYFPFCGIYPFAINGSVGYAHYFFSETRRTICRKRKRQRINI